jgi:DNA-binding protein Fis
LYLKALIERCQGNRSEAARVADLQRGYLRRLLHKYGLDGDASEDEPAGTR